MGVSLTVATGYGFVVDPEFVTEYNEARDGDGEDDFGEFLWDALRGIAGVESDSAYFYDYYPQDEEEDCYVVFAKSTVKTTWGSGVFPATPLFLETEEHRAVLKEAREALGLTIDQVRYGWHTVVSCG